ncbi:MAG TPA: Mth938-like domain-containing protein [Burkholderiaceae bacterium]|nr:Mth938-like domain-containing protein [Burkholderiaceae bacterium]
MKLQSLADGAQYALTGYGPGYLEVNRTRHDTGLLVSAQGEVRPWEVASVEQLGPPDFEAMLGLNPEVVLLGTGDRQRFINPRLYACLTQVRIGVEIMDTGAACRTYNILMSEGRHVLAALIPPAA